MCSLDNFPVNEVVTSKETISSGLQIRRDKVLGWIPNPQTPMNHFYNQVHESFVVDNVPFLAVLGRVPQGGEAPEHSAPSS